MRIGDGAEGTVTLSASEGSTKKQAQQEAARLAFDRLRIDATLLQSPKG